MSTIAMAGTTREKKLGGIFDTASLSYTYNRLKLRDMRRHSDGSITQIIS